MAVYQENELIDHIDHQAIVVATDPQHGSVTVRVDDSGECGSCPAAALCGANGNSSNTVEIMTREAASLKKGDIVTVRGTERMHRKAVMYATVLPCIALVAVMVAVFLLTGNQVLAALCGLGAMIIFFFILWAARNRVAHEFCFEIVGTPERAGDEPLGEDSSSADKE